MGRDDEGRGCVFGAAVTRDDHQGRGTRPGQQLGFTSFAPSLTPVLTFVVHAHHPIATIGVTAAPETWGLSGRASDQPPRQPVDRRRPSTSSPGHPRVRGVQPEPRAPTARAMTSSEVISAAVACTPIRILTRLVNGMVSVGLNALEFVVDRYR